MRFNAILFFPLGYEAQNVPVLWEFHKVHHSAETLNPITTFRAHPVDLLVMAWIPAVMTGLLTWAFNQFTDIRITFYTYLGLHVILVASNLIGTLRHTNVWLSYGPSWSKWFVSPAQHQLHHSFEAKHIGCNRGFELAIWDRLYGTLRWPRIVAERQQTRVFGTARVPPQHQQQLAPLLRSIAIERGEGEFELELK